MEHASATTERCDEAVRALVLEHLPRVRGIVRGVARRYGLSVDHDELVQGGVLGLIDAARRFRESRGCGFAAYAEIRIRGAVVDQLRALDWLPRSIRREERALGRAVHESEQRAGCAASALDAAESLGLDASAALRRSVEALDESRVAASGAIDPLAALCDARARSRVEAALASLPEAERGVVALIYWTELGPEDAARALGLEPCSVRKLHARALGRLRVRLRELCE